MSACCLHGIVPRLSWVQDGGGRFGQPELRARGGRHPLSFLLTAYGGSLTSSLNPQVAASLIGIHILEILVDGHEVGGACSPLGPRTAGWARQPAGPDSRLGPTPAGPDSRLDPTAGWARQPAGPESRLGPTACWARPQDGPDSRLGFRSSLLPGWP